jgi:hypothetical protein
MDSDQFHSGNRDSVIDILKQHARERRLTIVFFIVALLILTALQTGIRSLGSPDTQSPITTEKS